MPMPKAAMDKNDLSFTWENQVWATWQISPVETVTVPHGVNHAPHCHLGACISIPDF